MRDSPSLPGCRTSHVVHVEEAHGASFPLLRDQLRPMRTEKLPPS